MFFLNNIWERLVGRQNSSNNEYEPIMITGDEKHILYFKCLITKNMMERNESLRVRQNSLK